MKKIPLKSHETVCVKAIFLLCIVSLQIFRILSFFRMKNSYFRLKRNDAKNTFFRFEAKKVSLLFRIVSI